MDFLRHNLATTGFRLTVALFNQPAIVVYERVGFTDVQRFVSGSFSS